MRRTTALDRAETTSRQDDVEYRKEALSMALYVAICLLAAFAVLSEDSAEDHAIGLVWGTTLGLSIAHWFAFQVAARLVAQGSIRPSDAVAAGAQLVGAAAVAVIATVPVVLLPPTSEVDGVIAVLAAFIACVGYGVARAGGASQLRAVVYGASLLVVAGVVVVVKILVSGH